MVYECEERTVNNMKRFFGMMPSSEIEVRKIYDDGLSGHLHLKIDAGPNGWTLHMADGSTRYKDESKGTEKNLAEAEAIEGAFPEYERNRSTYSMQGMLWGFHSIRRGNGR